MRLLLLILVFIVVPLAELYVILKVGDSIGWAPTILILVADSLLGSVLLRNQGRSIWNRFNSALNEGRIPHREVMDGVLVIFGGAFLITPGFITDVLGLILLIPPTRAVVRRIVQRRLARRVAVGVVGGPHRPPGADYDVEGTASRIRPPDPGTRSLSAPALALSFFDPAHEIHGTARSGATILFEGRRPRALPRGARDRGGGGGRHGDGSRASSTWRWNRSPSLPTWATCACGSSRVRGEAAGRKVDCLGTLAETTSPPRWEELDALRTVSALVDEEHALLMLAERPRGALGHGQERVTATLLDEGSFQIGRGGTSVDGL